MSLVEQTVGQTVELLVIRDAIMLMWRDSNIFSYAADIVSWLPFTDTFHGNFKSNVQHDHEGLL